MTMFRLERRTALVTGAGQGMGEGVAITLAAQGARVLVNDLERSRAEAVVGRIRDAGDVADMAIFDVTDHEAVVAATAEATIDILINNAGNGGAQPMSVAKFAETTPDQWAGPLAVNLGGVMNCTHAVLPAMIERGWGRVVGVVSGAGTQGVGIGVAAYSAGKGGAAGLLRSVALEVAATGVTVNSIALGLMSNTEGGDVTSGLAKSIPTKRLGTPGDLGALCAYLASDEASWMTAQTIPLAGGAITS